MKSLVDKGWLMVGSFRSEVKSILVEAAIMLLLASVLAALYLTWILIETGIGG